MDFTGKYGGRDQRRPSVMAMAMIMYNTVSVSSTEGLGSVYRSEMSASTSSVDVQAAIIGDFRVQRRSKGSDYT